MPFLRFHFVDEERLAKISKTLIDKIEQTVKCPRVNIVLEIIHSTYIFDGKTATGWPLVEVTWFRRPPEIQDKVAQIIYESLKEAGYADSDVHFGYLQTADYYENGKKE